MRTARKCPPVDDFRHCGSNGFEIIISMGRCNFLSDGAANRTLDQIADCANMAIVVDKYRRPMIDVAIARGDAQRNIVIEKTQ